MSARLRREVSVRIQELSIKGYSTNIIHDMICEELAAKGERPITARTVARYIKDMENVTSDWWLNLARDHIAYIVLHRRNILALELQAKMIYDKIKAEGGVTSLTNTALNNFVKTLKDITMAKSELEKEIPQLGFMTQKSVTTPEQAKEIEANIIAGLPADMRARYEQLEKEKREKILANEKQRGDLTELDLSQYPEDTFIV